MPVTLLGFYSRPQEGVITHPGDPLHVHAVLTLDGEPVSGHVDVLRLTEGAKATLLAHK